MMEDIFQEKLFARNFASNNKIIRDKTLREIQKWFRLKNSDLTILTDEHFLRVWKGLYYCLWMTDKPLIQEEVCEKISNFVHCWDKSLKNFAGFVKSFFLTLRENWYGLDQLRLDKFLMLTRRMNRQILFFLVDRDKKTDDDTHWEMYSKIVLNELLEKPENSLGLTFHFVDLIIEELAKVTNGKLATSKLAILIKPFMITFLRTFDKRLRNHIEKNIFVYLIKQNPTILRIEEQYNAWKRAGRPGTSYLDMQLVESDATEEEADEEESSESTVFDPRAGRVNVVLNGIDFEADIIIKTIVDCLQRFKTKPESYRRGLRLCKSFQELNQGINPFLKFDLKRQKHQIQNIFMMEQEKNKQKETNKRKQTIEDNSSSKKRKLENNEGKNKNFGRKAANTDIQIETTDIQMEKADIKTENFDINTPTKVEIEKKKIISEKQNQNFIGKVKSKNKTKDTIKIVSKDVSKDKITDVSKDKITDEIKVEISDEIKVEINEIKDKNKDELEKKKKLNLKKMKILAKKLSKKQELSPKQIKKKKLIKKKNLKLSMKAKSESQAAMSSETKSQGSEIIPKEPKDSTKRVSIQLDLNTTQDFSEYCKTLKDNPKIPYDPEKRRSGILKPSITTPTNPFYKTNKKGKKNKNKFRRNPHK